MEDLLEQGFCSFKDSCQIFEWDEFAHLRKSVKDDEDTGVGVRRRKVGEEVNSQMGPWSVGQWQRL